MKNEKPIVSVGIPTYNRAASCRRAIESVLAQEYSQLELIISDNASTDETEKICREFAAQDNRVRYIRQETNCGAIGNFDYVLQQSRGKYFMWLGDDDWIDSDYLTECVAELEKDISLSLVAGRMKNYLTNEEFDCIGASVFFNHKQPSARTLNFYRSMRENEIFYGIYRRELLAEVNVTQRIVGADSLMLARIAFLGRVKTIETTHVHRFRGGASASAKKMAQSLGAHPFQGRHFGASVAWFALRDILKKGTPYQSLPIHSRFILGLRAFHTVFSRHEILPRIVLVLQKVAPQDSYKKLRDRYRKTREL